jgi:hypothetical protein
MSEKTRPPGSPLGVAAVPMPPPRSRQGRVSLLALSKRVAADQLFMCVLCRSLGESC